MCCLRFFCSVDYQRALRWSYFLVLLRGLSLRILFRGLAYLNMYVPVWMSNHKALEVFGFLFDIILSWLFYLLIKPSFDCFRWFQLNMSIICLQSINLHFCFVIEHLLSLQQSYCFSDRCIVSIASWFLCHINFALMLIMRRLCQTRIIVANRLEHLVSDEYDNRYLLQKM